jgi:hypothetical protein
MPSQLQVWLPTLSLVVAGLAVFIGPFVSWRISKRQAETSLRVANKQMGLPEVVWVKWGH